MSSNQPTPAPDSPVPIYLVKKMLNGPLSNNATLPRQGRDGTHWALEVRGIHYHIEGGELTRMVPIMENIPEKSLLKFTAGGESRLAVGKTAMSHEEILRICEHIILDLNLSGVSYGLFSTNCQDFANRVWRQIIAVGHSPFPCGDDLLRRDHLSRSNEALVDARVAGGRIMRWVLFRVMKTGNFFIGGTVLGASAWTAKRVEQELGI